MAMIDITPSLHIDESEFQLSFVRGSGPGGQNINKVATTVQLRFDIQNSPSLRDDVKERLIRLGGSRVTGDGVLVLEAGRFRTQEQNREDAVQRLVALVRQALYVPKPRRPTRPSKSAKAARVDAKKKHGEIKRMRRAGPEE
jgi:ribosome-associated protein